MIFAQTGTSADPPFSGATELAGCSGTAVIAGMLERICSVGGSAGGAASVTLTSSAVVVAVFLGITVPASTTGSAGTWTVRFNVSTANMNLTCSAVYVCRASSDGTNQETIGSATGLAIDLSTTGVKSQNVTGSAVTLAAGDFASVQLVFTNAAMSLQAIGITFDQNIDSPFSVPAAFIAKPPVMITRQSRNRASLH